MAGKSTMRFSASKNRLRRRAGTFWNAGLQTMQEKYSQGQVRLHTSTKNCRNHGWYLDFADLPAVACIKNLSPLTSREVLEDRSLHDAEKIFLGAGGALYVNQKPSKSWLLPRFCRFACSCIKNLSPLTSRDVLEGRSLHDAEKYSWGEVTLYTSTKNCLISLRYRKSARYNGNS